MATYRLQEPNISYEREAIEYIEEFIEDGSIPHGTSSLSNYLDNYRGWLEHLEERRNVTPTEEVVPSLTYFLVSNETNHIIGMINIRLTLNESLRRFGGHIGYSIRPSERGQHLSELNLYLALQICLNHGIEETYLDCCATNIRSRRTMESLGAIFDYEGIDPYDNELTYVYHINTREALETHALRFRNQIEEVTLWKY